MKHAVHLLTCACAVYWRVRSDTDLACLAAVLRTEAIHVARHAGLDDDRIRMIDDAAREGAERRAA